MHKLRIYFSRMISLAFVVLIVAGICVPVSAEKSSQKVLKVGYMDYSGFIDKQPDGLYTGYCVEYLEEIAKYTGYRYEYVYGQWPELLQMLHNGEIDLLCSAQYNQERDKLFDYSSYPIGYTQGLLYAKKDNDSLYYEDYRSFDNMTVGMIKQNAMLQIWNRYCDDHNFHCDLKEYDSEEKLVDALNSGEVEAICSEHLANHTRLNLLAKFGSDAYYIISYKNSPYMDEIDYALQSIKTNVDFEADLFHKYYDSSTAESTIQFTTEEKEFINSCPVLKVGLNQNRMPFSAYDKKTGEFDGICVDILNRISEESGLEFELLPQSTGKTTTELISTGNYDLICGVERDNFISNRSIVSTDAFFESSVVPVGYSGRKIDINSSLTAAVPSSYQALKKKIISDYPNIKIVSYNTNRECLDAVMAGDADIHIQNTHILSCLLQEPRYEELDIIPAEIMTEHTAMALKFNEDHMLLSVLNKSIKGMDETFMSSCLISHTFASPYHYTTADILYKFRIQIVVITIMMAACFFLIIRVAVIRKRSQITLQKKNVLLADSVVQADRASTAKTQFLSKMSHEIRTPINAIVGFTEIAENHDKEPDKIDDCLKKIRTSSKVLLSIINDILDMSAIESNKLKISDSVFDIKQVLNGVSTLYYSQCKNKGIRFEMSIDIENEMLRGDSLRVSQILLNLVSNAYKFTDQGGVIRIIVKETAHKDNVAFLCFTVSDSGCGMAPDMLSRIFKPFEQETADTAQKYGGSGLGLSITKNLVGIMHGAISVESQKNKGTTFTVNLPFEIAQKKEIKDVDSLRSVHILVADDDASSCEYTKTLLSRIGLDFDICHSGDEALGMIKDAPADRPYDVCLIDWSVDENNGGKLIKDIRQISGTEDQIIIASSYDISEMENEAKAAGADYCVSKPLFQSTVFNVLMELTKGELVGHTPTEKTYDFSGHHLLLAEDRELNAEIAIELLKMVNMSADHARNGQEALEMFENSAPGTYDMILMDIQMPVMNGYDSVRAIRALDREDAKTIPVYAMTANAFTEDISHALSSGMNGHIAKPIDTKILYEIIYKEINK